MGLFSRFSILKFLLFSHTTGSGQSPQTLPPKTELLILGGSKGTTKDCRCREGDEFKCGRKCKKQTPKKKSIKKKKTKKGESKYYLKSNKKKKSKKKKRIYKKK